ncbi:unnamed protein product, partial [Ectocarpus sp. 12 AP-2014]
MPPTPVVLCCLIAGPYTLPMHFSQNTVRTNVHDTARSTDRINIHRLWPQSSLAQAWIRMTLPSPAGQTPISSRLQTAAAHRAVALLSTAVPETAFRRASAASCLLGTEIPPSPPRHGSSRRVWTSPMCWPRCSGRRSDGGGSGCQLSPEAGEVIGGRARGQSGRVRVPLPIRLA